MKVDNHPTEKIMVQRERAENERTALGREAANRLSLLEAGVEK